MRYSYLLLHLDHHEWALKVVGEFPFQPGLDRISAHNRALQEAERLAVNRTGVTCYVVEAQAFGGNVQ